MPWLDLLLIFILARLLLELLAHLLLAQCLQLVHLEQRGRLLKPDALTSILLYVALGQYRVLEVRHSGEPLRAPRFTLLLQLAQLWCMAYALVVEPRLHLMLFPPLLGLLLGAGFLLLLLLSGMTWTGFWGKQYADLWNRFPVAMWNDVPKSDIEARSLNTANRQTVPWAMENTPMPVSGAHAEHMAHAARTSGPAAPGITLQAVVDTATARQVEAGYSITLPTTATGVFTIAVFADDPRNDATLHVDQYTGEVLADVRWQHYSNVARATEMGVMLHEGKLFGPLNQIVMLLVCLMILLSSVSGLVIWWKRRPQGGLGVPPLRHDLPTWKAGVAIMLALAIAFPLVGASLIAVWGLDRLWLMVRKLRPDERLS